MIAQALAVGLAIGGLARWLARRDADIAHRNLAALLAEQVADQERADERAIADNLDI